MFLKQVYKYNKGLFILFLVFILGQLFINIKRGMVVSPFYHYGMYSAPLKPQSFVDVDEVFVNGKQLQGKDFSAQQWDKIILPINYFVAVKESNAIYFNDVKRLMAKAGITTNDNRFILTSDTAIFKESYSNYLSTILNEKVDSIKVQKRKYTFTTAGLQPTDTVYSLSQLCR